MLAGAACAALLTCTTGSDLSTTASSKVLNRNEASSLSVTSVLNPYTPLSGLTHILKGHGVRSDSAKDSCS